MQVPARQLRILALDDVHAAGVRAGDEASLLEDQVEQAVDLALGGERARDLDQLAELVAVAGFSHLPRLSLRAFMSISSKA